MKLTEPLDFIVNFLSAGLKVSIELFNQNVKR